MRLEIDTAQKMLELDGVRISFEALFAMLEHEPDPQNFYQFRRQGNDVIVSKTRIDRASLFHC